MTNIIILDTSVCVYDTNCLNKFENSQIILPIIVIEELDKLKSSSNNEVGKNARTFIRQLDKLMQGDYSGALALENGSTLNIDVSEVSAIGSDSSYGDNKILACALKYKTANFIPVVVSRDFNLRIRAQAFGLKAQSYDNKKANSDELFAGNRTVVNKTAGKKLSEAGFIFCDDYELEDMCQNEYIVFTDKGGNGVASGRRIGEEIRIVKAHNPWGLAPRGKEQLFAIDALMDDNVPLVSLIGGAGCGKTLLSVSCGLELVLNKKKYDSLMIYRPIVSVGAEIGYLPGDESEKLAPYFTAIDDAFAFLFSDKSRKKDGWKQQLFQYINNGTIQKEALAYIRGRSIPNALILIDEAQNLTPDEMKTILTRAGEGTKIIITGDPSQIDQKQLDAINNGLTYVAEKFKNSALAAHITLTKGERSALATEAANIL